MITNTIVVAVQAHHVSPEFVKGFLGRALTRARRSTQNRTENTIVGVP